MREKRGFTPHAGMHFPSEPVSQYICMKLPITDNNDRTHKNDANPLSLHVVLSRQVPHERITTHLRI